MIARRYVTPLTCSHPAYRLQVYAVIGPHRSYPIAAARGATVARYLERHGWTVRRDRPRRVYSGSDSLTSIDKRLHEHALGMLGSQRIDVDVDAAAA